MRARQAAAQPLLSAEEMVEVAGKLDLVNNVFQNGVHGSLRDTIVEVRGCAHYSPASIQLLVSVALCT